jgi:hypothetical protein
MTKRNILIGIVALVLICMCVAVASPSKKDASATPTAAPVATVAGQSAQPTSAPIATAAKPTNTPRPTNTPQKPALEVLDHSILSEQYARYVVGTVRNNSTKTHGYVQVSISLYDKSGALVGSTLANVNGLEPGGLWKFKAIILEDSATSYKIKEVTGF